MVNIVVCQKKLKVWERFISSQLGFAIKKCLHFSKFRHFYSKTPSFVEKNKKAPVSISKKVENIFSTPTEYWLTP